MSFLTISFYSGIILLILCILVVVSPLRERFSTATQKIQGFGVNLEVSVLTLLVLISVGLMTSGIWMQLQDISSKLKQLEIDKTKAEERARQAEENLARANKVPIAYEVALEGVNDISNLNIPSLSCKYVIGGEEKEGSVLPSAAPNKLKVYLPDLQRDSIIESLAITNSQTNEQWVKRELLKPLRPEIELARKPNTPLPPKQQ